MTVLAQVETLARIPVNDLRRSWVATSPEVQEAAGRVIESGRYVHGPEHRAFEDELAAFLGVGHAVGVASGTDALVLSMLAVGCSVGSEIVTAANAGGYASTAAAQIGAEVVYCDVNGRSLLATASTIEPVLAPSTKAVVVTHLYGNVADIAPIIDLCRPRGIAVIEDCAQAIGGRDEAGHGVGTQGDVGALSFYPTKNLGGAGDGGAVITNDVEIDVRVRRLRQYGWQAKYVVESALGRNSRLDELQAAILRVGLGHVAGFNQRRRAIVARYAAVVREPGVRMITGAACETVGHLAVARAADRDALRRHLERSGIDTDIHYPVPDHRQPGLRPPVRSTNLPETERASDEIITLPCFPEMTDDEVGRVVAALAAFAEAES